MIGEKGGRWPTVYDAEGLDAAIKSLAKQLNGGAPFYALARLDDPPVCAGDIIHLKSDVPHIDENGDVVVNEPDDDHWLIIGNTCDFARDPKDVQWTQVVPLVKINFAMVSASELADLKNYKLARRFYVPIWPGSTTIAHYFADFLRPVAVHRGAFGVHAKVVARLTQYSWSLLHSCLVRFMARDDGRFDPG